MRLRVIVHADRVGVYQVARILRQAGPFALRRAARIEQVIDVVHRRSVLTGNRAVATPAHRNDILQGGEIVLAMRDGDPVGDIRVRIAVDMRHAELVADDFCRVGPLAPGGHAVAREERLPRHQADGRDEQQ